MHDATTPILYILVVVLGLCLGSFATALIHRLPLNKAWFLNARSSGAVFSRSICPTCGHTLSAIELVPVFSWLFSLGKCRHCSAKISPIYPVTEIFVALIGVVLFAVAGTGWSFVPVFLSLPFLIALIVTNIRTGENFPAPSAAIFVLGLLSCLLDFKGLGDILAAILLPAILCVSGMISFGWGAVKDRFRMEGLFLGGAGFFVGLNGLPLFLLLTAPMVAAGVIYCVITKRKSIDFFPAIYAIALIFHFFLTGIGFDGRAVY